MPNDITPDVVRNALRNDHPEWMIHVGDDAANRGADEIGDAANQFLAGLGKPKSPGL